MLNFSVFSGFIFLINSGLTFGILKRELREIKLYEKLKWSFKKARLGIIKKFSSGLIVGLFYGLNYGLIMNDIWGFKGIKIESETLIYSLIIGLIFVLISGWVNLDIQHRIFPNQGIKNSVKNSTLIGLIIILFFCLFYGIIASFLYRSTIIYNLKTIIYNLNYGLFFGSIAGFIFWVRYGGSSFIEHFSLRHILYRQGHIPWNYACFLDHASECRLMKKVGGGYIFYHRMLMEHFAQRHQVSREPHLVTPRQTSQPVAQAGAKIKVHSRNIRNTLPQPDNPIQNHIVCSNCNHQNPITGKFCIKCGSKLV